MIIYITNNNEESIKHFSKKKGSKMEEQANYFVFKIRA